MDTLNVELELGITGRHDGKLILNGMDLSHHVSGLRLRTDVDGLTELYVRLSKLSVNKPAVPQPVADVEEREEWRGGGDRGYCVEPACYSYPKHDGPHRSLSGEEISDEQAAGEPGEADEPAPEEAAEHPIPF